MTLPDPSTIPPGHTTECLARLRVGDPRASEALYEQLHAELRRMAGVQMAAGRGALTLQPTALVNEVWLRLGTRGAPDYETRGHFLAVAAKAMRSVLVDAARRRRSDKRGGLHERVALTAALRTLEESAVDVVAVSDALERLAARNERQASVVELRFFAGLAIAEVARVLGIGTATVERDWHLARIWLRRELSG